MCRPMVWARAPWIAGGPVARMTASIWYWPSGKDGSRSTKLSTRCTPGSVASQRLTPYSSATRGARQRRARTEVEDHDDARGLLPGKLSPHELLAPARLGAGRQHLDVAGGEPDSREGRAQQEQHGRHRDQHPPGMVHDHGGEAHPEAAPAVRARAARDRQPPGVQARAQHGQQRGQEGEPVEHGEEDDEGAAQPDRSQVAEPQRVEPEQPDGHGEAREEDRRAGRRHRPAQRLLPAPTPDLLAVTTHDEQRVVDGHREADHGDDVDRVEGDGGDPAEQERAGHPARHRQEPHAEGHRGGHDGAEDQQQQHGHHGQDHELGAHDVAPGDLREVVVQRERTRRGHGERVRAHERPQRGVGLGPVGDEHHGLDGRRVALELDGDARVVAVARESLRLGRPDVPGGADRRHAGIVLQRRQRALDLGPERRIGDGHGLGGRTPGERPAGAAAGRDSSASSALAGLGLGGDEGGVEAAAVAHRARARRPRTGPTGSGRSSDTGERSGPRTRGRSSQLSSAPGPGRGHGQGGQATGDQGRPDAGDASPPR